ncbi:hypothetical protein SAMN05660909_02284 [Chitinophaga terrae (ex Kim and Jung 2007)]|uniref:Uncharacterized protein n=1 Tax=Chitinophaga terrae (ex Kim and Jung 2007) TaxID=408074 RepID=A0A1H4BTX4_9BACT|nr:hypothetical protein SAMN05660909_02284 [Chitinophaga terrae (ex Kim and Jung 2007)]
MRFLHPKLKMLKTDKNRDRFLLGEFIRFRLTQLIILDEVTH